MIRAQTVFKTLFKTVLIKTLFNAIFNAIFNKSSLRSWLIALLGMWVGMLVACSEAPVPPKVRIALNPWPGYELIYLAEQKGFFKELGADIEVVQLSSLADVQRAYMDGRVDGMGGTIVEAVATQMSGAPPLDMVLVTSFSNGGDMIVAKKEIASIKALKGRRVGCEVSSLGIYILQRALGIHGLTLDDVTIINTEQANGQHALESGEIDAFVTYPPESVNILKAGQYHTLFTTRETPKEIIDVVLIEQETLNKHPELYKQLQTGWQRAMDYMKKHPEESISIMAQREGISDEEFQAVLGDIELLSSQEQLALLGQAEAFKDKLKSVCLALMGDQEGKVQHCEQHKGRWKLSTVKHHN